MTFKQGLPGWRVANSEWLWHLLWASGLTAAGMVWLLVTGPMRVVSGTTPLDDDVPLGYMITAFPFLGILLADLANQLRNRVTRGRGVMLLAQTGLVCVVSVLRLRYRLPVSGHLLLLAFFLLYTLGRPRTKLRMGEATLGALVFIILLGVKVAAWSDWLTPALAVAIAVVIWAAGRWCDLRAM